MKIVVCIKHVPDVQSERRLEDARLVRGEDDVLNELDENAVEAAVSLVEDLGGRVVALTGADVVTTARALAAAIGRIGGVGPGAGTGDVDLVVTGMASLDAMTSMLPGALAAALHVPALTLASSL